MTNPSRIRRPLLALAVLLILPLAGCPGASDDKGDNGDIKIITPKPSKVQDANTAGENKSFLPVPEKSETKLPEPTHAKPDEPAVKPADPPKPDDSPKPEPK